MTLIRWGMGASVAATIAGTQPGTAQSYREVWMEPSDLAASASPAGTPCIEGAPETAAQQLETLRANPVVVCAGVLPEKLGASNEPPPGPPSQPAEDTFGTGLGYLNLAGNFGYGEARFTTIGETTTSIEDASVFDTLQQRETKVLDQDDAPAERTLGPTSNILFGGEHFEGILEEFRARAFYEDELGLSYGLVTAFPDFPEFAIQKALSDPDPAFAPSLFFLTSPTEGAEGIFTTRRELPDERGIEFQLKVGLPEDAARPFVGRVLTYGGIREAPKPNDDLSRAPDNFLLVDLGAAKLLDQPAGQVDESAIAAFIQGAPKDLVFARDFDAIDIDADPDGNNPKPTHRIFRPDPDDDTRVLFAAGDLDGVLGLPDHATGVVATRFLVTPGITGEMTGDAKKLKLPDFDSPDRTVRAFLRRETWTDLDGKLTGLKPSDITDRGLYVVNPAGPLVTPGGGADAAVLHADFGLDVVGAAQVSSISATIGSVDYRLNVEIGSTPASPRYSVDAILSARTVGSSNAGGGDGSILMTGDLVSTAAGGGNPRIDIDGTPGADPGRLGFMVLQNAGKVFDDAAGSSGPPVLEGGMERPLGGAAKRDYGLIRLATASGSLAPTPRHGFPGGLWGYAMGWVEVEAGDRIALAPFARAVDGPNLTIGDPDLALNRIAASLAREGGSLRFGGPGYSAYVDDLTYGMLSTGKGSAMAMISAETVGRELSGRFHTSDGAPVPVPIRDLEKRPYRYVQWGMFMGDAFDGEGKGPRQHVHLGTYAAGAPIDKAQLRQARGIATYTGHAIGNVYDGGRVRTALGTIRERFDFDQRAGSTRLDFDRRKYTGRSRLAGDAYGSVVKAGDRTGQLDGRFVGGMSGKPAQPNALVGGFEIQNGSTQALKAYRATGTFGAERR